MKAIVLTKYGTPDDLELGEVEKPFPKDDELLIEVHASAVHDWDWGILRSKPLYIRVFTGLWRPKIPIMGCDVAGRIEAVGTGVTRLKAGTDVYGDLSESGLGGFAEYVCAREGSVAPKPTNVTYEQAVAAPHAPMLAQQALRDIGQMREGQTLLININGAGR